MNPPIHILGAGSLGLLFGSKLAAAGPVVLLRRSGWQGPPVADVTLHEDGAEHPAPLPQAAVDQASDPIRRLVLATKAHDALPALRAAHTRLTADTELLLLQNGMGSQDEIAAAGPAGSVDAAVTTEGAWRPAPDRVVHAGHGATLTGPLRGPGAPWAERLAAAGLTARTATDIRTPLADKLRVNALINPLTVLYNCRNGELLGRSDALADMATLGQEADAVLAAAGFVFAESALDRAMAVAQTTADNVSSMLQDARAGRRLEIDHINGYVVRLGERLGIGTPVNRGIWERLGGES